MVWSRNLYRATTQNVCHIYIIKHMCEGLKPGHFSSPFLASWEWSKNTIPTLSLPQFQVWEWDYSCAYRIHSYVKLRRSAVITTCTAKFPYRFLLFLPQHKLARGKYEWCIWYIAQGPCKKQAQPTFGFGKSYSQLVQQPEPPIKWYLAKPQWSRGQL